MKVNQEKREQNAQEDIGLYRRWIKQHYELQARPERAADPSLLTLIVIYGKGEAGDVELTAVSVVTQTTVPRILVAAEDMSCVRQGLETPKVDTMLILRAGDLLLNGALETMYEAAQLNPGSVVYADHDFQGSDGLPERPYFKGKFNQRLTYDDPLWLGPCMMNAAAVRVLMDAYEVESPEQLNALAALVAPKVNHVGVLATRLRRERPSLNGWEVRSLLRATGRHGEVVSAVEGRSRVQWCIEPPYSKVSIIVPFRDRADLLNVCLDGLRSTTYPQKEIILLDNGSRETRTRRLLANLSGDYVIIREEGVFNFSRLINRGAVSATGDLLLFLNNDIEVTDPTWLDEMVAEVKQPGVGAVGARLLYPNGLVQHAGVVLGMGVVAGHEHRLYGLDEGGYQGLLLAARECFAVTGACMLTRREAFEAVGGMDPRFATNFNDVEYCARLAAMNWQVIVTPHATLVHKESQTRRRGTTQWEVEAFRQAVPMQSDPYYSGRFAKTEPGYTLAWEE